LDYEILDQGKVTTTAEGGTLALSDGLILVVPPGIIPAGEKIEVFKYAYTETRPETTMAIYRFATSKQPSSDVAVTFPIPGATSNFDKRTVYATWFHGDDSPQDYFETLDKVAKTITVSVKRFSTAVISNKEEASSSGEDPLLKDRSIIKTTFFNQGVDQYCWAVSLTMLVNAYGANLKPWETATYFRKTVNAGYPALYMHNVSFVQFGRSIKSFLAEKVGAQLPGVSVGMESERWFLKWEIDHGLKDYLIRRLRQNKPVMITSHGLTSGHAQLVVGFQLDPDGDPAKDQIFVADPANSGGTYGVEAWSYDKLAEHCKGVSFGCVTVAADQPVPKAIDSDASIGILRSGKQPLVNPETGEPGIIERRGIDFSILLQGRDGLPSWDLASPRRFTWYNSTGDNYGMEDLSEKPAFAYIGVDDRMFMTVGVASNVVLSADGAQPAKEFKLSLVVADPDGSLTTVVPNAAGVGSFVPAQRKVISVATSVPVKNFAKKAGLHKLILRLEDAAGKTHDTAVIPFAVEDKKPKDDRKCGGIEMQEGDVCDYPVTYSYYYTSYHPQTIYCADGQGSYTADSGATVRTADVTDTFAVVLKDGELIAWNVTGYPDDVTGHFEYGLAGLEAARSWLKTYWETGCQPSALPCPTKPAGGDEYSSEINVKCGSVKVDASRGVIRADKSFLSSKTFPFEQVEGKLEACKEGCVVDKPTLPNSCDAATAYSCKDENQFCGQDPVVTTYRCQDCYKVYEKIAGKNCDGLNECDCWSSSPTTTGNSWEAKCVDKKCVKDLICDPKKEYHCTTYIFYNKAALSLSDHPLTYPTYYCNAKTSRCEVCPAGTRNCDGVGDCEPCANEWCDNNYGTLPATSKCAECRGGGESYPDGSGNWITVPPIPFECGDATKYCSSSYDKCYDCPSGNFNCDGMTGCTCTTKCIGTTCDPNECDPNTAFSCPAATSKSKYCGVGSGGYECKSCPSGTSNCDGLGDCECTGSYGINCAGTTCGS
jgi:hypothetical protein